MFKTYTKSHGATQVSGVILSLLLTTQVLVPWQANAETYSASATKTRIHHGTAKNGTFFQRHPKVKAAAIGGGVGAAGGALVGDLTHHGVMRGAAIGAGTGAGVGLIRSSNTMKRHPIVKDLATGSAVGLGIGMASGRHRGLKGAAIGGAVGLGAGLLRKNW